MFTKSWKQLEYERFNLKLKHYALIFIIMLILSAINNI